MGRKHSDRQAQALSLRAAGASYQQIADTMGMNKATAYRLIQRALPRQEPDEQELQLDLVRLDQALMSIWPQVRSGDLAAVNTMIKLTDVRERLRTRWYMRGPATVVNQDTTVNQLHANGVLVIQGQTKDAYIQGLRAARGELPPNGSPPRGELPAPQSGELGQQLLDENRPANQGVPAVADTRLDGHVQVPGLVDESGDL